MKKIIYFPLCLLLFLFATACSQTPELPEPTEEELAAIAKRTIDLINQHRMKVMGSDICDMHYYDSLVSEHSQNMADGKVAFGHEGFKARVAAIKRVRRSILRIAEIVGKSRGHEDPAQMVFDAWLASPKHKEIIECTVKQYNFAELGVARAKDGTYYFTYIVMLYR